jgi:hypothetical protein
MAYIVDMLKHIKNNFILRDYFERVLAITLSVMAGMMAQMGETWLAVAYLFLLL